MDRRVGVIVMGTAIGTAQTFLLREFVDKQYGPVLPQLGAWGYPSVLAGLGIGGITTLLGVAGLGGYGPLRGDATIVALAYGIPALVGGVLSALYPVTPPAAARARVTPGLALRLTPTVRPATKTITTEAATKPVSKEILA